MNKPFELKALGNKLLGSLKAQAVPAAGAILDWTSESCAMVNNGAIKILGGIIAGSKPAVLAEVDKAVKGQAVAAATVVIK